MTAVPGDTVRHEGTDYVVVDVDDNGYAVLRTPDDMDLESPVAATAEGLEVTGHVQFVDGWVELEHGTWERTGQ